MYSYCECVNRKIDISCGSATCQARPVYLDQDILKHITVVKTGMICDLPSWWWTKAHHFRAKHFDMRKFVEEIKDKI